MAALAAERRTGLLEAAASAAQAPGLSRRSATAMVQFARLHAELEQQAAGGVGEMRRVTRPGGRVSACVWDHGGGTGPLSAFWRAVLAVESTVTDESSLPGSNAGDLTALFLAAGLHEVSEAPLTVAVDFPTFDAWWEPYTFGVGTAGVAFEALKPDQQDRVVELLRAELGDGPFTMSATAWAATGVR